MLRLACTLVLLLSMLTGAAAETTALPGLIWTPLSTPIALADGHHATLEGLVIRPDRPGDFLWSFWCMVHLDPSQGRFSRPIAVFRRPGSPVRPWCSLSAAMRRSRSFGEVSGASKARTQSSSPRVHRRSL
jgi:hypothetical protein